MSIIQRSMLNFVRLFQQLAIFFQRLKSKSLFILLCLSFLFLVSCESASKDTAADLPESNSESTQVQSILASETAEQTSSETADSENSSTLESSSSSAEPLSNQDEQEKVEDALKNLAVNQSIQLVLKFASESAVRPIKWSSSNTSVVQVNQEGLVTAVSQGSATLTIAYEDDSEVLDLPVQVFRKPLVLKENIHESLSQTWQDEYHLTFDTLKTLIPLHQSYFNESDVYAWNDKVEDPFPTIEGGKYVSISSDGVDMVLEIPNRYFINNLIQRYSVLPHEYFHLYQLTLNVVLGEELKWLIEGCAAVFESLYVRENYNINNFVVQRIISDQLSQNPAFFESYESNDFDINYGTSVFMVLSLTKKLQSLGYSEEQAFRKVFYTFLLAQPGQENWPLVFSQVFGFSVESFYDQLKDDPKNLTLVLPSENLKIEDIFNSIN